MRDILGLERHHVHPVAVGEGRHTRDAEQDKPTICHLDDTASLREGVATAQPRIVRPLRLAGQPPVKVASPCP